MFVCLFVLYRNPNRWTDLDEIWHGGGPWVQGAWWVSGASAVHFGGNFIKQKLLGTPNLVGVGHLFGHQIRIILGNAG